MTRRTAAPHSSVDAYIASAPKRAQSALAQIRRAIRTALPDAEETISYKMPAYRQHGRVVVYFAAWSEHFSLYPANTEVVARFRRALEPYEIAKSTIHFRYERPVPTTLISRIAKFRAQQVATPKRSAPERSTVSRGSASKAHRPSRPRRAR